MSSNKRPFDWLGVLGSGSSSKRVKSPAPQATSSNISSPNPSSANQSSNSPSTSPSTDDPRSSAPVGGQASSSSRAVLSTLKGSMRLLRKGCEAFPPLHSTVGSLLEVFEAIETTKHGSEELLETSSDLAQWATVLSDYLSDSQALPEEISDFVERLEVDLAEQAEYIQIQQRRGKLSRLMGSEQEMEALERYYRRIETSFHQLQTDAALRAWKISDDHLKESRLNALNPSHNARYNSSFSDKIERKGCLENTRGPVLDGIRAWIRGPSSAKIHWMNGMAGTGKTTIAYSVCAELERDGRLGASFFCSRASSECNDVSRILPTIAYQLALQFYPFRSSLCRILGEKPSIGQCNISVQFEHLIETPLIEVGDTIPNCHVVVIDALDECSDPRTVELMLDALFNHAAKLPIRFFLTSRPEPAIANTFLSRGSQSRSILHLHNVEEQLVKADIETYLTTTLAQLSLRRDQIKQLAEQAGVLFIYASTLARYILGTRGGAHASKRLITALTGNGDRKSKKDREIDLLYKAILDGVLGEEQLEEDEFELIKRVLWTVVCVREPVTIGTLAGLLEVESEHISSALQPLQSVLQIFEGSGVVSTLHASFAEFILSSERSGPLLYCDWTTHHEYLARRCFQLLEQQLEFNICGLETSYRLDKDVLDLEARIKNSISSELFYACRYWAEHLSQSSAYDEFMTSLDKFLHEQLLFWMEVLNLKGWMGSGAQILAGVQDWLTGVDGRSDIREFVHDARNFVATFATNSICQSTPHIYVSALPLVPKRSMVWKSYWGRTRGLLSVDRTPTGQDEGVALEKCEFQGHTDWVTSVAFSLDGSRIVSGSSDATLRLWNACTGTPLGSPLRGHTDWVRSVAFSPDGARIVSGAGSSDCTIRVWDSHSGTPIGSPLKGHARGISSVAFSPDGTRIVSGSYDCTIRVWDVHTGTPLGSPFKGHISAIGSVAFSPDGAHIVSGSWDRTIRVWNVQSRTLACNPFEGHAGEISSVAFSPDGTRIVSGSWDSTVRVWDVRSSPPLCRQFKGHADGVTSVVFLPDGARIVSGSRDGTIRVWDADKGTPFGSPFKGHSDWVTSVAILPNGNCIVSGSYDYTIRVWEVPDLPHPETPMFNNSGWLVDSTTQASVFWLPKKLRNTFPRPPSTLTISPLGPNKITWSDLMLGESWAQCYKPYSR